MKIRTVLTLCVPLILSTGCVPKIEKAVPMPESRIDQELKGLADEFGDETLVRDWWKSYGDEQLDTIMAQALANAPTIRSIEARYAQANALIESVESQELPHLSFRSSVLRERFSENHIFPAPLGGSTNNQYEGGIVLDYDFDFWDKRKARILSAKETAMAELASIEAAKIALASAISQVYLSWHYDEEQLKLLSTIEATVADELALTRKRYRLGLTDASALYRSTGELSQVRQRISSIRRIIEGKKESICVLGGFLPSYAASMRAPQIAEHAEPPLPKEVMLHLLSHRPDVAVAKHTALSKSHTIDVAKARFYPDISLTGLLGFVSFDWSKFLTHSSYDPNAGVALSLPLLDWGEREAVLKGSLSDYNASVFEYNQAVIQAANEVTVLLKQSRLIKTQLQLHAQEMEAKRADTAISERKLKYALANKLPYLSARRVELESEFGGLDLEREQAALQISLIQSLGGGFVERRMP